MKNTTRESTSTFSPNILESLLNSNYRNMAKSDDINKLIENKFYCSRKFSEQIETIANDGSGMKYIDRSYISVKRTMLTLSLSLSYYLNL